MEITKCEFCNAYITNFEVHNCMRFGNQHRGTSATLPQCSSGNVAEDIEFIKAEEMEDEALWPFVRQSNSSTLNQINQPLNQITNSRQQSISSGIHQRIDCEETAAAEMASQYGDSNQNSFIPSDYETEPTDYLFPDMRYIQENDVLATHLQLPPEVSNAFMNQNPQNYESSNPEHAENTPMSAATRCVLPGFQKTFDRRNPIFNTTHPSASSVNCEQISKVKSLGRTACTFKDVDAPQNTKYSLHKCSKCPMKFKRKDYLESHERVHNVEKPYVCSFCDKAFARGDALGRHIRTHTGEKPYACTECGKCFADNNNLRVHIRTHTFERPYACNTCSKRYTSNGSLKYHMLEHAEEEISKCNSCGTELSSEESLGAHKCRKCK
ncbi:hypothetical protein CDAR_583931 [Caerostris darwini]|uniref:C2H2-type domain-containing protein n=1 Tax=Caerostris darwini TaxID=1538125 RepID=A0AAV4SAB3_9ARAC|nr:hypothetical protein CDAR_583931 [Caerostris darwini]